MASPPSGTTSAQRKPYIPSGLRFDGDHLPSFAFTSTSSPFSSPPLLRHLGQDAGAMDVDAERDYEGAESDSGASSYHSASAFSELPPEHFLSIGRKDSGSPIASLPMSGSPPPAEMRMADIPVSHFLYHNRSSPPSEVGSSTPSLSSSSAPRPDAAPDTTTLAAADFDIDVRSGFLPPEEPLRRLGGAFVVWEEALEAGLGTQNGSDEGEAVAGAVGRRTGKMVGLGGGEAEEEERQRGRVWRKAVREMPILHLPPSFQFDIRALRRAYVVLSFLGHAYIHSQPPPDPSFRSDASQCQDEDEAAERTGSYRATVPLSIAVPWFQASERLGLPPVLTYSSTVLWNWRFKDPRKGLVARFVVTSVRPFQSNVEIAQTFTNTASERHFYITSLLIELRGVEALRLMALSLDEAFVGDCLARRRLATYLCRLAAVIDDLTTILADTRRECLPSVFYHGIRPWFVAGDANKELLPDGTERKGWIFQGIPDEDEPWRNRVVSVTGPSAGQSSLIHALDLFLDVDHSGNKRGHGTPSDTSSPTETATKGKEKSSGLSGGGDETFMARMKFYMPYHHRAFLTHLANSTSTSARPSEYEEQLDRDEHVMAERRHPIRSLAQEDDDDGRDRDGLAESYDEALLSLKKLRDEHMRIVALYIISQARLPPPSEYSTSEVVHGTSSSAAGAGGMRMDEDRTSSSNAGTGGFAQKTKQKLVGTGGTDLVSFLKMSRQNTLDAMLTPLGGGRRGGGEEDE